MLDVLKQIKADIIGAISFGFVFFVLNGVLLNNKGPWIDELLTYSSIIRSLKGLIIDRLHAGHSPIYFIMLKGWADMTGSYDIANLRLFSLIFASAFFGSSYYLMRGFAISKITLSILMGILLISPFMSFVAQTARMYGLLMFLSVWNIYYFTKFIINWKRVDLCWAATFWFAAYLIHPSAIFILIGELAFLFIEHFQQTKKYFKYIIPISIIFIIGAIYIYVFQGGHAELGKFSMAVPKDYPKVLLAPVMILSGFSDLYCFRSGNPSEMLWVRLASWLMVIPVVLGLIVAVISANKQISSPKDKFKRICIYLVLLMYLLLAVIGLFGYPRTISLRYYSLIFLPLVSLYVLGCCHKIYIDEGKALQRMIANGLICILLGANIVSAFFYYRYDGPGLREVAAYLKNKELLKERIIFPHASGLAKALAYYRISSGSYLGILHQQSKNDETVKKVKEYVNNADRFIFVMHAIPGQEPGFLNLQGRIEAALGMAYEKESISFNQSKIVIYKKHPS